MRDLKRAVRADLWKSAAAAHIAGRSMLRQRRGMPAGSDGPPAEQEDHQRAERMKR